MALFTQAAHGQGTDAVVDINGTIVHQTIDGWGAHQRLWDDPHFTDTYRLPNSSEAPFGRSAVSIPLSAQEDILDKLYKDLKLTQTQPVMDPGFQASKDGAFDYRWKLNDGHIDLVNQAFRHGLKDWMLYFIALESWMSTSDPAEQVEYVMVKLRRWKALGREPQFVNPFAEPSYNTKKTRLTPVFMRELIRGVGRTLKAEGFSTKIVTPGDIGTAETYIQLQTIMADPEVRGYVGVIATHPYWGHDHLRRIRDDFCRPYDKPLWMEEYSAGPGGLDRTALDYAEFMHDMMAGGVGLMNYQWGSFGQWEDRTQLISVTYDASNTYTGYTLTKEYFLVGQFSRFIAPGAIRVDTAATDPTVKVTAYKHGANLVIVVVNNTDAVKSVAFNLSGFSGVNTVQPVRTSATEDWTILSAISLAGSSFTTNIPARSVTTFTTDSLATSPAP